MKALVFQLPHTVCPGLYRPDTVSAGHGRAIADIGGAVSDATADHTFHRRVIPNSHIHRKDITPCQPCHGVYGAPSGRNGICHTGRHLTAALCNSPGSDAVVSTEHQQGTLIDPDIRVPGKSGNPYHRILQHAETVKRFRNCIPLCSCLFFCRTIHRYRGSDQFI